MEASNKKTALQVILLFGLVSLFGDIIYEGARSVNGPYLKTIGANAAIVGLVVGIGEFFGYAIRFLSGFWSDKTKAYWLFTFVGYGMLVSVPLLALTGIWQTAALFIVLERIGKAMRSPAKDTILSQATKQIGTGMGFAIGEVMDQIGAIAGPLMFTFLFMSMGKGTRGLADYQKGYTFLWIPFVLLMVCVWIAYLRLPDPSKLETSIKKAVEPDKLSRTFWLYTIFSFITTLGFTNFALLGYHYKVKGVLTDSQIPLFYAIAMGVDAIAALVSGKLYDMAKEKRKNDKAGLTVLLIIPVFTLFVPFLGFSNSFGLALAGAIVWGVVMGCHETIMKSAIADITPLKKRGTGYGIFNAGYGLAVFIGSAAMGFLYDRSLTLVFILAAIVELASIPVFFMMKKEALK
jgi:MFS family permease